LYALAGVRLLVRVDVDAAAPLDVRPTVGALLVATLDVLARHRLRSGAVVLVVVRLERQPDQPGEIHPVQVA